MGQKSSAEASLLQHMTVFSLLNHHRKGPFIYLGETMESPANKHKLNRKPDTELELTLRAGGWVGAFRIVDSQHLFGELDPAC